MRKKAVKSKLKGLDSTRIAVILCVLTMVIYFLSYMDIKNVHYPLDNVHFFDSPDDSASEESILKNIDDSTNEESILKDIDDSTSEESILNNTEYHSNNEESPMNDTEYSSNIIELDYDPYMQLFDAFMKGQLHLDWEVDEKLLELENPYNLEERTEVNYLWDRAYYDGKYYTYFGITPIITIMFPFYFLSGMLPSPVLIQFIYMLIFAIVFPKLLMMLLNRFGEKTPTVLKILITYTAYLSSFDLLIGRGDAPFYYIACTAAIAFLTWFAYLFFKGVFTDNHKERCIYFLVAGLMFAFSFHARVNKAFMGVFYIVPIVIFYIILGKQTKKKKLIELGCLGFFVIIGFVISFLYNYARFDDILEFGANYQLTVTDVSAYKLDISEFDDAIEYYYKTELIDNMMNDRWEFMRDKLKLSKYNLRSVDRYLYVSEHFGLYAVPFMLFSLMAVWIVFSKKNSWPYKITLVSTVIGGFIMAWLDFCLGGVIFRYLTDFSTEIAVCSALVALYILEMTYSMENKKVAMLLKTFVVIVMVVSIYKAVQITVIDSEYHLFDIREKSLIARLFNVKN